MGSGTLSVPVTVQSGGALSTLDGNAGGIARYGSLILSDGTSISLDVFGNAADRIAVDSLMASGNLVVNLNIVSLSVGVTNTLLTWNAGWGASTYTLGSYNPLGVEITSLNLITNANSLAVAVNGYDFSGAGATQTISFPTIPNQIYGIPSLILAAQASSGLVVSYRSSDSNVAVISGNLALIQGAGTTTITAVQQGDSNWVGAFVSQRLIVEQASNVITPFGAISNQTYSNNASMTITTPTASSGLPVAVTVKSGPATISGNSVSLTGAGIVVLAANQNGNANYQKASEVTASFSVGMGSQSISFPAIPSQTYGSGPVALEATASSGLPVSYVSSSSNVSISGASVTILGSGTATIVASQLGNSNWSTAVPVTNTLVIAQASNVITPFGAIPNQTYSNNASMTITTPTASSGLPVVVTVKSGPATISGNSVSLTGAGTVVLAANQNGNANYQQASEVTASFSVAKAENMIPFGSLPACTLGDLPLSLPSKTADGLPITYTSSDTNVAFVTQNPVAEVSSDLGTFVMELLPSNAPSTVSNFLSYSNAYTNSFFQESLPGVMIKAGGYEADPSLTAIATHAPVLGEYSLPNDRGTVAMMTTVGKSGMVSSEWFVNLSNNTSLYDPTNSLGNPPGAVFGRIIGSGMNVADAIGNVPTFDSGVPFHRIPLVGVASNQQSFGITNLITLGVTCIAGPAVIPLGVGTVTITATQEGDSNHEAAPPVTQTLVINRMPQSIGTIPLLTNQSYGSLPFLLPEVISSAGLPCTWAVKDGPAVINGNYLSLTGVGVVTLSAMQSGNKIYSEAPIVNKSFTSLGPISGLKSQSIVFKSLPAKSYGTASFPLFGLVKSGLPIAYFSSSTNVAVISGNMVTITGVGSTQITAYQPGDGVNWNAASPVTQVLVVNGNPQKILFKSIGAKPYGVPAFAPVASVSSGLPITFTSSNTNVAVITNGMILPVGVGNTLITASQSGSASYAAAPSFSQSLTITPGIQRINFASLGTNTYGCASIPLVATSSAGLPVGFSSSNTNVAVIRGNLLEIKGAGSAKITATQPGNSLWGTAKSVTQTLTIAKASQSLTFSIPSNVPFTNGGLIPLTAISSSGLPVVYKSGNSTILTIAGTTCVIMKRGTTTIVASQPGGANYIPAPPVTNTITVQ
jgi:cyclophilin family peptidyl-prolyl cis-trans isomerase